MAAPPAARPRRRRPRQRASPFAPESRPPRSGPPTRSWLGVQAVSTTRSSLPSTHCWPSRRKTSRGRPGSVSQRTPLRRSMRRPSARSRMRERPLGRSTSASAGRPARISGLAFGLFMHVSERLDAARIPSKPYALDKRYSGTRHMRDLHEWTGRPLALSHLRVFEAAARLLSFTAAGEECALSQSAVSRHVAEIERQVGQPLFVRRTRALELTPAGAELLAAVQPSLARIDDCVARLRMHDARYRIDITTFASFASMWLVPRLAEFQTLHPEADIRLSANDRYVDVDREGFTLALRGCDRRQPPPGAIHLFDETVAPMCSPQLAEQAERERRPLRGPADLAQHVLLDLHLERPRANLVDRWDKWFREIGHPPVRPRGRLIFDMIDQMHQ